MRLIVRKEEKMSGYDFEDIYKNYFSQVHRYALFLTNDEHLSEEITQETFFKALQSLDRFRGESSINTWLCAIAKNIYLSGLRKKDTLPLDEMPEKADDTAGPEEAALVREEARSLYQKLHELPEPYKEVFTLRVFAELSFREIGELFGKSENWACVVYHRARGKLHEKEER